MSARRIGMLDWETGEPPRGNGRKHFAEHLSTYAKSGTEKGNEEGALLNSERGLPKPMRITDQTIVGLTPEGLAHAGEMWAKLPRFDDLIKRRACRDLHSPNARRRI